MAALGSIESWCSGCNAAHGKVLHAVEQELRSLGAVWPCHAVGQLHVFNECLSHSLFELVVVVFVVVEQTVEADGVGRCHKASYGYFAVQ